MPLSEECRREQHEDCGGNGDMFGCTCDCHKEADPDLSNLPGAAIRWYILNDQGEPVPEPDMLTAARWFETADRKLAAEEIGEVRVSTVFLGLDHGYGDGPPVLWETMIFGGPLDGEQRRYTSRAAALAGHAEMVAWVRG